MSKFLELILHPSELRAAVQWKIWHEPMYPRDPSKESDSMKRCFELLQHTSRSFSVVILELEPEMRNAVMIFYVILRGLDTIEDDMTIPNSVKLPLLRSFHEKLFEKGWTYHESKEKDSIVLEEFDKVTEEFSLLKPIYQEIIADITKRMGNGMADYCADDEFNKIGVDTIKDYDLYCYYVAGIVGEGMTRLSVAGGKADPRLLDNPQLHISMGLFLQKNNIIRDYHEDLLDNRRFWPKEIWGKYADSMDDFVKPEMEQAGIFCLSELVANALEHVPDCLQYLTGIKEQTLFNFCAIPQVMAIATLELVFQNPKVLTGHVKIRKGTSVSLIMRATSIRSTFEIFQEYTHRIHSRNKPNDPNYMRIEIACGKIDQFVESVFPTPDESAIEAKKSDKPDEPINKKELLSIIAVFVSVLLFTTGLMCGIAYLFGARFDLAFKSLTSGLGSNSVRDEL
ncbi:isoprenoid synthase domain-containing protein [Dipodascopsis uninucleata]